MEENQGGYDLAGVVIGLAMKVHSALGPGFLESVYENALAIELEEAGVPFERQKKIDVRYKNRIVGDFVCDFLIAGQLIVELKSTLGLVPANEVQTVNYLTATGINEGLLLNFGAPKLQFKKKFRQNHSVNCFARSRLMRGAHPAGDPAGRLSPFGRLSHPSGCFPKQAASRVPTRRCSVKNASVSAFTMLELLVSMAVLSLLIVLLLSMVDNATKMWRQSENRVDAYREARAALNLIASDLASIYSSANTNFFRTNSSGITLSPSKISPSSPLGSGKTDSIFFITALPSKAQDPTAGKSDLCEVGYYVSWSSTSILAGDTNRSQNLHRFFRSSDPTFEGLKNNAVLFNSASSGGGEEILAKNITGFTVATYTKDSTTPGKLNPFTQSDTTPMPDVLEITLSAISNEAAKRFTSQSDWSNTNSAIHQENVRTFTKRVVINRDASTPTPSPSPSPSSPP